MKDAKKRVTTLEADEAEMQVELGDIIDRTLEAAAGNIDTLERLASVFLIRTYIRIYSLLPSVCFSAMTSRQDRTGLFGSE